MEHFLSFSAALGEINGLVARTPDAAQLLQQACELIVRHTGATAAYIVTLDDQSPRQPRIAAARGPDSEYIHAIEISVDPDPNHPGENGVFGHVYRKREPIVSNDTGNDARFARFYDAIPNMRVSSVAGIPIFSGNECRGSLVVATDHANHFDEIQVNLLERIQQAINASIRVDAEELSLHASIGVALYPRDGSDSEDPLRRADLALFRVKKQGGNHWGLFEKTLEQELLQRHRLREHFTRAVKDGEIVFHYQPTVDLREGKVVGAEALVRWNDPEKGLIPPSGWIHVVEENPRLISLLGRHALASAMHQLLAWHDKGEKLWVSVNIGVRHLLSREFIADLRNALSSAPELAPFLVIELTETALIRDFRRVAKVLTRIRSLRVRVALDDFGTGQASLTYLLELPTDRIKIDLSFVLNMLADVRAFGIVSAAAQGAWTLGMDAVAEGVETEEHGLRLLQMGCRYAQGFGIAPPLQPDEFQQCLANWKPPACWHREKNYPLTQEQMQLLASIIMHRTLHHAIHGNAQQRTRLKTGSADARRHFPCPLLLSRHTPQAWNTALRNIHQKLHQIENTFL